MLSANHCPLGLSSSAGSPLASGAPPLRSELLYSRQLAATRRNGLGCESARLGGIENGQGLSCDACCCVRRLRLLLASSAEAHRALMLVLQVSCGQVAESRLFHMP